ncbi:glycosyltransferase family 2 protein [Chordicoccus furentiruminis]|uniref:glycosyltransferase family 2 protein n=1 Tax=Chordicoccus furentiruminis TaxID=2709410 RepID=UPI0023A84F09|nr:glycosyltransferase family 2 protein [Chordicoccus furentiruminis]
MKTISVITPFYRGNAYINHLADVLEANAERLAETAKSGRTDQAEGPETVEWLIVNDSPDSPVSLNGNWPRLSIRVIDLPQNGGIHHARAEGLRRAKGEAILFLDQDDRIAPDFLVRQKKQMEEDADVAVCGVLLEKPDGTAEPIYRTKADLEDIRKLDVYLRVKNPIRSPGQCLIRRSAIPDAWSRTPMKRNGSDDLLLWIMMLARHARFIVMPDCLYTHRYTGENVSDSIPQITASSMEMTEILRASGELNQRQLDDLRRSVEWGGRTSEENRRYYLKDSRIFLARLWWKIRHALSAPLKEE